MNNIKSILDELKHGRNVFLTGGAGVGKSYTIDKIIKSEVFKTVVLASTALAAVNIGGDTVHRFFKLRLAKNLLELRTSKDELMALAKSLNNTELIIIDEISMISAEVFEMIALRLKSHPNIRLLVVGDFYQLEPVKASGNYAFNSSAWDSFDFKVIELDTQYRMEDKEFYEYLQNVRIGKINQDCINYFRQFIINDDINNYDDYTIICGTNDEAKNININKLKAIDYPKQTYYMKSKTNSIIDESDYKSWLKGLPIEEEFIFKLSAKVIFTSNSDTYFNGMQGEIIDYDEKEEELKVKSNYMIYTIKPKEFYYFSDPEIAANYRANPNMVESSPDAVIKAFPLKLAYAITIHKSQGMSINKLICKCDKIFAQGQLYVALSRSTNPSNFKILFNGNNKAFDNLFYTKARANNSVSNYYELCKKDLL